MCFHSELKKNPKKIKPFKVLSKDDYIFKPIFHVHGFTYPLMPIIILEEGEAFLKEMNWGLITHKAKNWEDAKIKRTGTLNAKVETVNKLWSFSDPAKKRHCIVPITGFYENFHRTAKDKYPFYISPKGNDFFFLAGIWDTWLNKESGEKMDTFSILTTEPNELMRNIHNKKKRMPVILQEKDLAVWLKNEAPLNQVFEHIAVPFDQELMRAHPITKDLNKNSIDTNIPEVSNLVNYEYPEVMNLAKF